MKLVALVANGKAAETIKIDIAHLFPNGERHPLCPNLIIDRHMKMWTNFRADGVDSEFVPIGQGPRHNTEFGSVFMVIDLENNNHCKEAGKRIGQVIANHLALADVTTR